MDSVEAADSASKTRTLGSDWQVALHQPFTSPPIFPSWRQRLRWRPELHWIPPWILASLPLRWRHRGRARGRDPAANRAIDNRPRRKSRHRASPARALWRQGWPRRSAPNSGARASWRWRSIRSWRSPHSQP